jgi:hypothetical protein
MRQQSIYISTKQKVIAFLRPGKTCGILVKYLTIGTRFFLPRVNDTTFHTRLHAIHHTGCAVVGKEVIAINTVLLSDIPVKIVPHLTGLSIGKVQYLGYHTATTCLVLTNKIFPRNCHADIVCLTKNKLPNEILCIEIKDAVVEYMVIPPIQILNTNSCMPIKGIHFLTGGACEHANPDISYTVRSTQGQKAKDKCYD